MRLGAKRRGKLSNSKKPSNPKTQQRLNQRAPNPPLKSGPACIASRSLSAFRYPGSAHRLGAGVAA
jgi:hypothetical protein